MRIQPVVWIWSNFNGASKFCGQIFFSLNIVLFLWFLVFITRVYVVPDWIRRDCGLHANYKCPNPSCHAIAGLLGSDVKRNRSRRLLEI